MKKQYLIILLILFVSIVSCTENKISVADVETNEENQTKPWTRWWWMGSAVDSINLKQNLIDLHKVGIGGVEIAPIYGVKGEEENFIDYLSPRWMNMLNYTIKIADSLQMGVDLTLGTGWPYGGPQVTQEYAATKLITQKYEVKKGEIFTNKIIVENKKDINTTQIKYVLAYSKNGTYQDLSSKIKNNTISWQAKDDDYTIYFVFTGKTRQQVKRAAPGAKGLTLDHYSEVALNAYVQPFNNAFKSLEGKIRSIFNDSYEVYRTDFTPNFFEAFKEYRKYDLKPYLPLLLSNEDTDLTNRFKSDYRETLADLLLLKFNKPWTAWANKKGFKTRLQAHGSPGNLLDLYASADIPECETFGSMPYNIPGLRREKEDIREGDADPVMLKFSSSAAHISGKPLTSSETFTWLRDHFKTALSQTKPEVEDLFLNGINHVFLHGTTYTPKRAKWPGWKFYASVNFHPNLGLGENEKELFSYIQNCQELLQKGTPDNETLLYWPIYDVWNSHLDGALFFQFKIHSLDEWLHNQPFYKTTKKLIEKGYGLDFISDRFIDKATVKNGKIILPGGQFKTLIVPKSKNMPLATMQKLKNLQKNGANIIFEDLPKSVPGFYQYKEQNKKLAQLSSDLLISEDIFAALAQANVFPEKLVDTGLKYIKRDVNGHKIYYLVNHTSKAVDTYVPININDEMVEIFDPKTTKSGLAFIKKENNKTFVKVQINAGDALFLLTKKQSSIDDWEYFKKEPENYVIEGNWNILFLKGGPILPKNKTISTLESWTNFSENAVNFSGTASYTIAFKNPNETISKWLLKLGDVRESAKVWVNDHYVGSVWANPFEIQINELQKGENILKIEVTNLAANRIRAKEMRGEEWKIFYEINMVDKDYQQFDATKWNPMPSGILGPVSLIPLKEE